ncbi:MAG: exopolysaccharide biosynthesis protein [Rhodospirillales bacterium 69-11]|nr:polysaccharide export protein [Rhodospirillales bacterium]OJW27245.1 MAG: exopolysaccharide biosynthesis protein [Rhodospirillales bacterium 69-11]
MRLPPQLSSRLAGAALILVLTGCAPGRDLPPLPPAPAATDYHLGPGDAVRLITFGEEQLTGEFRVSDGGTIALPLVGTVRAAGLTPVELERAVADALKRGNVLRNPSVSAEVIAYRPIFVLGEVNRPGQYPYQPGMTVVTAVAVAGGFTYRAVEGYASVLRTTDGTAVEGRAPRQAFVQPGDVVTVFERRF